MTVDRSAVEAALGKVFDPCSVRANAPLSVIDMGLINGIAIDDEGGVAIVLRPTSAWCTMVGSLMQGVEEQVGRVRGVRRVTVEIDTRTIWSEADLTPAGKKILGDVRARSRAVVPLRRQAWKEKLKEPMEG